MRVSQKNMLYERKTALQYTFTAAVLTASFVLKAFVCNVSAAPDNVGVAAYPTGSNILVDGNPYQAEAYNIANYNYFKLRGLAAAVDCAVSYDEINATVVIDTSAPYIEPDSETPGNISSVATGDNTAAALNYDPGATPDTYPDGSQTGNPGATPDNNPGATPDNNLVATPVNNPGTTPVNDSGPVWAVRATLTIVVDSETSEIETYNIGGYNYFKLRDFLSLINTGVWYDRITDTIHIETDKNYDPDYAGPFAYDAILENYAPAAPDLSYEATPETSETIIGDGTDAGAGAGADAGVVIGSDGVPLGPARQTGPDEYNATEAIVSERQMREYREKVAELVNAERIAQGRNPLVPDETLFAIAQYKCNDMVRNNYFSHISPEYGDIKDLFKLFGVDYYVIGENIATGHTSPEMVVQAWMESPGHRANILDADYEYIGVGFAYNEYGETLWAQTFLGITNPKTR